MIKYSFLTLFFLIGSMGTAWANPDTLIQNVEIYFSAKSKDIPKDWVKGVKSGKSKLSSLSQFKKESALKTVKEFLNYYPTTFIAKHLRKIYVLDTILDRNILVGGKANYLEGYIIAACRDSTPAYNHRKLLITLHHEFSHNIRNTFMDSFPHIKWSEQSSTKYGKGGHNAIKKGSSSKYFEPLLCSEGFLHSYGKSSAGEDFASFAENLFLNHQEFWKLVDQYPLIKAKKDLTIQFYQSLDPFFTEDYFKNLPIIE